MGNIRDVIYNSNTSERIKQTKKYKELLDVVIEKEKIFTTELKKNDELIKMYHDFDFANGNFHCEECITYYEEGFRTGVLLGLNIAGYIKEE